jgi:hypothetical protein
MMFQQHQEIKKKVSKIPKRYVNVAICPVIVDIYTSLQVAFFKYVKILAWQAIINTPLDRDQAWKG